MTDQDGSAAAFLSALEAASEWSDFCGLGKHIPKAAKEKAKILEPFVEHLRKMENSRSRSLIMDDLATVAASSPALAHQTLAAYFELAGAPDYPEGVQVRDQKLAKGLIVKAFKKQRDDEVLQACIAAFRNAKTEARPEFWDARLAVVNWVVQNGAELNDDDRALFSPLSEETTASLKKLGQLPLVSPKKSKVLFKTVDHGEEKEKSIGYFDAYLMAWLQNIPSDLRLGGDGEQALRVNLLEPRIYGKKFYLAWGWLDTDQKEVCLAACNPHPRRGEPSVYSADHEPPHLVESMGSLHSFLGRLEPA